MRRVRWFVGLLVLSAAVFFGVAPAWVQNRLNGVHRPGPYRASDAARAVHEKLRIVDMHADPLLWGRDLAIRSTAGHIDVPRMLDGNVAIQGFTIVTKTPRGLNIERNDDTTDSIFWLAMAQRWPLATLTSLAERALFQAQRLHDTARRSGGRLRVLKSRADLAAYLADRAMTPHITAGFLGIEGAHALDGSLDRLDDFERAGIRMVGLAHFFDNAFAGSSAGLKKGGLTDKGRQLIAALEARHMLVDLAHSSTATIAEVLALAKRPLVVSHTGVRGTCDNRRNLSDDELRGVAKTGGLVGIGFWETACCGRDAAAIARAIKHAVGVAGLDHVGLGSDFDGATHTPFDATGMELVTEALLKEGFTPDQIRKIMGENALRVLDSTLP